MSDLIRTPEQYDAAMSELSTLLETDPTAGTPEADRAELLAVLIAHYEEQMWPQVGTSAVAAIEFRMEQQGLRPTDVAALMGVGINRFYEVMNGTRELSKRQMRNLAERLKIPAGVLLEVGR